MPSPLTIGVQPAGAVTDGPRSAVMAATRTSPAATPEGLARLTVELAVVATAVDEAPTVMPDDVGGGGGGGGAEPTVITALEVEDPALLVAVSLAVNVPAA